MTSREIASPIIELMSMATAVDVSASSAARPVACKRWAYPLKMAPAQFGPSQIKTAAAGRSSISPNDVRMIARFSRR